jgi:hypothetical protein
MTTTQPTIQNVQLGQVVIVTQSGKAPVTANVTHVTKSGQFKTCKTGEARFKARQWGDFADEIGVKSHNSRYARLVVLHTDEKFNQLTADHASREAAKLEEQNARQAAEAARQADWAAKVAAVRSSVPLYKVQLTTLPDGSRLHTYTFDTRMQTYTAKNDDGSEQLVTEDAGWLWVVIACKDVEELDYAADSGVVKVKKVEAAITFRNERSSAFSSCSTENHATEEDAIYDSLTYAYHRY